MAEVDTVHRLLDAELGDANFGWEKMGRKDNAKETPCAILAAGVNYLTGGCMYK